MRKHRAADLTKISLCAALLCVSSYLVLPLPLTPIVLSLHTVVVNLVGLLLSPGQAAATIGIYLLMGAIGLPVFSAGTAGIDKLFGPTGGFYIGFFFAAIAIAIIVRKRRQMLRMLIAVICVGLPIQHFFAVLWMCFYNDFQIAVAFFSVSAPFLLGDLIKCIISAAIASAFARVKLQHS